MSPELQKKLEELAGVLMELGPGALKFILAVIKIFFPKALGNALGGVISAALASKAG